MVKRSISIAIVGGAAALSACLADAPQPTAPTGAAELFTSAPARNCSPGTYIGPVAFGSNQGYVSFLPYQPTANNCGNTGGNGMISAPQDVFTFDLGNGALAKLGSAGMSTSGGHVQLAADGSGVAYAYNDAGSSGNTITVQPSGAQLGSNMGTEIPLGVLAVGSDVYVAAVRNPNTTGGVDLENPTFPNSGNGSLGGGQSSTIYKNATAFATWTPQCGGLDRCVVGNATSIVYLGQPGGATGANWQITQLSLADATTKMIAAQTTGADFPFGLDIDDHVIAWSTSQSCVSNMGGNSHCAVSDCTIAIYDTSEATPAPKTLLTSTKLGCVDAHLANGYVYFAIVDIYSDWNQLESRGIGRVKISDRTLETLDLGIRGPGAGPRRVVPIGDQLYLIDPLVMARIPASALDGAHDFTP